jgi:hypothetical protein
MKARGQEGRNRKHSTVALVAGDRGAMIQNRTVASRFLQDSPGPLTGMAKSRLGFPRPATTNGGLNRKSPLAWRWG